LDIHKRGKKHEIEERNKLIEKYISNPFWHIVLELLLNMIDKDQPDTEIIDNLLDYQLKKIGSLPFILSCLPSLKNVGENQIYKIIDKTVDILIKKAVAHMKKSPSYLYKAYGPRYMSSFEEQFFSNLQKLNFENDFCKTVIRRVLREKESQYPKYRLQTYILFLEIELDFTSDEKRSEIQNVFKRQDVLNVLEKNHFAYRSYLLYNNEFREDTHFKIILQFLDSYGFEGIANEVYSIYDNFFYFPLISHLRKEVTEANLVKLENFLCTVKDKGIDPSKIIEKFGTSEPWLNGSPSQEEVENILKYLDFDYTKEVKAYLLLVLSDSEKPLSEEEYKKSKFFSKYFSDMSFNKILKIDSHKERHKKVLNLLRKRKFN
jgi:hypothetical protein